MHRVWLIQAITNCDTVNIKIDLQGPRVYPAHTDALNPIEPRQLLRCCGISWCDHKRRQGILNILKNLLISSRSKIKDTTITAIN